MLWSMGVLLARAQGCILVSGTVSSPTDSCVDLQLLWCGPEGTGPSEVGRRVGAECGRRRRGEPSAQPASRARKTSPSSLNSDEPLLAFSILKRIEADPFLPLLGSGRSEVFFL